MSGNQRIVIADAVLSVCSGIARDNRFTGSLKGHGTSVKCRVVQGVLLVVWELNRTTLLASAVELRRLQRSIAGLMLSSGRCFSGQLKSGETSSLDKQK